MKATAVSVVWLPLLLLLLVGKRAKGQDAETDAFARCEAAGITTGETVAKAVCASLKSQCPPAHEEEESESRSDDQFAPAGFFFDIIRDTCETLFTTSCEQSASSSVALDDPDCFRLRLDGPGIGTEACPDFEAANRIFLEELELCNGAPPGLEEAETVEEIAAVNATGLDTSNCENDGKAHGQTLAADTCSALVKACTGEGSSPPTSPAGSPGTPDSVEAAACNKLFDVGCKRGLRDAVLEIEECKKLLVDGPDEGIDSCPDFNAVWDIFEDLGKVCDDSRPPPPDPCKCFEGTALNGVRLLLSGCQKICYMENGGSCEDYIIRWSPKYKAFWRLC